MLTKSKTLFSYYCLMALIVLSFVNYKNQLRLQVRNIYIREGGSKRKEQEFIGSAGCFVPGQGQWGLCCGIDLLRGRGKWLLEDINAPIA